MPSAETSHSVGRLPVRLYADLLHDLYDVHSTDAEWDDKLGEWLSPYVDHGKGYFSVRTGLREGKPWIGNPRLRAGASFLTGEATRAAFYAMGDRTRQDLFEGPVCGSVASTIGETLYRALARTVSGKLWDCVYVVVRDYLGEATTVIGVGPLLKTSLKSNGSLRQIVQHASAGRRLRRSVNRQMDGEVVLTPEGRVIHAEGLGREPEHRELLQQHVIQREKHLSHSAESTELPSALEAVVSGRWSLVDRFEEGGRRYIVAHRNASGFVDPRLLTERESEVLSRAQRGLSDTEIADELGSNRSTISSQVHRVVAKLGLRGRAQLPGFYRDLSGAVSPIVSEEGLVVVSRTSSTERMKVLSEAERATVELALRGLSDKEIAERRGVRKRTVANQLRSSYAKLGVFSRAELAGVLNRS